MANVKEIDFMKMFQDISKICLTEDICGSCQGKGCFIGYAREAIGEAKRDDTDTLPGAHENIPCVDFKAGYDEVYLAEAIAHTLKQCKSCKEFHYEDCLVNIVRSCFEGILFGDFQDYEGSALQYLTTLQEKYPEVAARVFEEYRKK